MLSDVLPRFVEAADAFKAVIDPMRVYMRASMCGTHILLYLRAWLVSWLLFAGRITQCSRVSAHFLHFYKVTDKTELIRKMTKNGSLEFAVVSDLSGSPIPDANG